MELFYTVFIKVKSFEMEKKHKKKKEGVVFECLSRRRHHSRHRARAMLSVLFFMYIFLAPKATFYTKE